MWRGLSKACREYVPRFLKLSREERLISQSAHLYIVNNVCVESVPLSKYRQGLGDALPKPDGLFLRMSDYRLSAKIIGRSSGRSSVAAAAYRAGAQLHDERTGLDHDYTRKNGVLHSEIMAPDNAPDWMKDRAKLWNAVEAVERRKDAQLAREIQLSLPHELDEAQNKILVLGFIQSQFVDRGMIADVAIHAPDRQGDQRNIHAHVMLTLRELTGEGFASKKTREWNKPELLADWRESWADHQNELFQELGMEQRVDHRSYADQGIDREPTQHLGTVANDMEKNGKGSRIGDENRARQERNAERAALAQDAAKTSKELAAEQVRQQERIDVRTANLDSHIMHDEIEMSRRHDWQRSLLDEDIAKRNDERRHQLEAEEQRLRQHLASDGWRKLMRDLLGKTRRDQEELRVNQLNLENIRMREASERQALQTKQDAERDVRSQDDQQRQETYAQKLELDRQAALQRTINEGKPRSQGDPSNDRAQPSTSRSEAPEQDNRTKNGQNFQKAAEDIERQQIREHLRQARERDNDRDFDRD